jgi:hypothetical protein
MTGNIDMDSNEIIIDTDGDTTIGDGGVDDNITFTVGAANVLDLLSTSILVESGISLDMNGESIIMDADADSTISAAVDDNIQISTGGSARATFNNTNLLMAQPIDMGGNDINNGGVVFLTEQAAAEADVAGKGQIWVKTVTPNELWFTDDAGTDFEILSTIKQGNSNITIDDTGTGSIAFTADATSIATMTTAFGLQMNANINMAANDIVNVDLITGVSETPFIDMNVNSGDIRLDTNAASKQISLYTNNVERITIDDSDFAISHPITLGAGVNIATNATAGSSFGGTTSQKISFYGVTPIVQQTSVAVTVAGIHAALVNLGLIT